MIYGFKSHKKKNNYYLCNHLKNINMHNAIAIANPNDKWFSIDVISCIHFRTIRPNTPFEISDPQQSWILLNDSIDEWFWSQRHSILRINPPYQHEFGLKFTFTATFAFWNFKTHQEYKFSGKQRSWRKCQNSSLLFLFICLFANCHFYLFTGHTMSVAHAVTNRLLTILVQQCICCR